jgi:hypothetical protein
MLTFTTLQAHLPFTVTVFGREREIMLRTILLLAQVLLAADGSLAPT